MSQSPNPYVNILISYAYYTPDMNRFFRDTNFKYHLVIDSGAFTAWKQGKVVKIEEYCDFIKSMPIQPWRYFNLDVVGNPEQSLANYEYMLRQGLQPIPIFTRGERYEMLDHYYETSDVVGIGGLVGTKNRTNIIKKVMRHVKGKKIHWLGFSDLEYLIHFKPYMCDSTSWSTLARYAAGRIYLGNGKQEMLRKTKCVEKPSKAIMNALQLMGFDPYILADKKNWKLKNLFPIGVASNLRLMWDVKKKLDVNLFIACCNYSDLLVINEQYNNLIGRKL